MSGKVSESDRKKHILNTFGRCVINNEGKACFIIDYDEKAIVYCCNITSLLNKLGITGKNTMMYIYYNRIKKYYGWFDTLMLINPVHSKELPKIVPKKYHIKEVLKRQIEFRKR